MLVMDSDTSPVKEDPVTERREKRGRKSKVGARRRRLLCHAYPPTTHTHTHTQHTHTRTTHTRPCHARFVRNCAAFVCNTLNGLPERVTAFVCIKSVVDASSAALALPTSIVSADICWFNASLTAGGASNSCGSQTRGVNESEYPTRAVCDCK